MLFEKLVDGSWISAAFGQLHYFPYKETFELLLAITVSGHVVRILGHNLVASPSRPIMKPQTELVVGLVRCRVAQVPL